MALTAQAVRRRFLERWSSKGPYAVFALIAYIPALLTRPGWISVDTKVYLYLDPGRLLQSATSMWDPDVAMGTVTHQTIGYLFPMGPYYWLTHAVGIPVWVAQRFWLGTMLLMAASGVVYLLRTMRWRGPGVPVAGLAYMLTPYTLAYLPKLSVIALPWAGLPWLIAFCMRTARRPGWRDAALFALTVQLIGGVNASSLAFVLFAAVLWLPFAVWVHREVTLRNAASALGRMALLTLLTSTWWLAGLWAQGRYGINVLQYTETAKTVAQVSTASEVLRGLGYWYFYGTDKFGGFVDMARPYTQHLWLLATSFLVPILALIGGAIARFRERAYFITLVVLGTLLSVGAYPWSGSTIVPRLFRWILSSSQAGSAMRSMPRAAPLSVLGLAVLLGAGVTAVHERYASGTNQLSRRTVVIAGLASLLVLVNFGPAFLGGMIAKGGERPSGIPAYWKADARHLDAQPHTTRVLELPGSDFASYRWNGKLATTVDPITPGLITRPSVARELIPFGTPPSANLLNAFDLRLQERTLDPNAIAPIARFMSAGTINLRNDLTYERYLLPRPRLLWNLVGQAPGLGTPVGFGGNAPNVPDPRYPLLDETELGAPPNLPNPPKVAAVPVQGTPTIAHTSPTTGAVVMAGDGSGLVDAASAQLLTGREVVLYAGSFAGEPGKLRAAAGRDSTLLLTDSNRRAAERWGTITDIFGYTEMAGEKPLRDDPNDQRLDVFPGATDSSRTVAEQRGGVQAQATGYGNPVTYTPEDRAVNAVDGDPTTSWRVGAFGAVEHEKLQLDFAKTRTADSIRLLQPQNGTPNRFITKAKVTFDDGSSETLDLGAQSRSGQGQLFHFAKHTFKRATIEILADTVGSRPDYRGLSAVGFAEVALGDHMPHATEYIRLPTDLLHAEGTASLAHPLALVMTRQRVSGSNAVRSDPELSLARTWELPTSRSFAITGTARLESSAPPSAIDAVLGLPGAANGGVTAAESRHLPGSVSSRATAAIDGNPSTAWSTGFLSAVGDWADYTSATPVTVDHLDLQVVADGRHSVPTQLEVSVDGARQTVDVPAVTDGTKPGTTRTVKVALPKAATGRDVRFTVKAIRAVTTRDWYSTSAVDLPVAVAEWGVPGLQANAPAATLDPRCRSGLVTIDGVDVPVSLRGTAADALAGKAIPFVACVPESGLPLPAGNQTLTSQQGRISGLDTDQVVLRSAAGGVGDRSAGPVAPDSQGPGGRPGAPGPKVEVTGSGRSSVDLRVTGIDAKQWLVFGQSLDAGWKASVDGHDLGAPTLVNGYANAWQIGPGTKGVGKDGTLVVHLRWTPQRTVDLALWISAIGGLLVLALILWPMRRRLAPVAASHRPSLDRTPSVPRAASVVRTVRYGGPRPTTKEALLAAIGFTAATAMVVNPAAGIIAGVLTLVTTRFRRTRPLLTFGAPLCLFAVMVYYLQSQYRHGIAADFSWPVYIARGHALAWMSVVLLLIDLVVDRLWLRRWWPTDDSPA